MQTFQSKQKKTAGYQIISIISFIILTELTILYLSTHLNTQSFFDIKHPVLKVQEIHNLSCITENQQENNIFTPTNHASVKRF